MATLNMVQAIRATLEREMERDERIILLGQDIGRNGGMFRATDGLQRRFGEARVVDMPLAEGVIIGSAVCLACSGLRPIPELQFLGFGSQAFHQLEGQVARMRFRSQGRYPMPIVIRAPFGGAKSSGVGRWSTRPRSSAATSSAVPPTSDARNGMPCSMHSATA